MINVLFLPLSSITLFHLFSFLSRSTVLRHSTRRHSNNWNSCKCSRIQTLSWEATCITCHQSCYLRAIRVKNTHTTIVIMMESFHWHSHPLLLSPSFGNFKGQTDAWINFLPSPMIDFSFLSLSRMRVSSKCINCCWCNCFHWSNKYSLLISSTCSSPASFACVCHRSRRGTSEKEAKSIDWASSTLVTYGFIW